MSELRILTCSVKITLFFSFHRWSFSIGQQVKMCKDMIFQPLERFLLLVEHAVKALIFIYIHVQITVSQWRDQFIIQSLFFQMAIILDENIQYKAKMRNRRLLFHSPIRKKECQAWEALTVLFFSISRCLSLSIFRLRHSSSAENQMFKWHSTSKARMPLAQQKDVVKNFFFVFCSCVCTK